MEASNLDASPPAPCFDRAAHEGALAESENQGAENGETLLLRGGGYSLPPPRAAMLPLSPGDSLVFTTDGVSSGFRHGPVREGLVEDLAADMLRRHGKDSDDALVLVARYIGVS